MRELYAPNNKVIMRYRLSQTNVPLADIWSAYSKTSLAWTRVTQTLGLHGRICWPGQKSLVLYRDADG